MVAFAYNPAQGVEEKNEAGQNFKGSLGITAKHFILITKRQK